MTQPIYSAATWPLQAHAVEPDQHKESMAAVARHKVLVRYDALTEAAQICEIVGIGCQLEKERYAVNECIMLIKKARDGT
jgi:hypothetical protein